MNNTLLSHYCHSKQEIDLRLVTAWLVLWGSCVESVCHLCTLLPQQLQLTCHVQNMHILLISGNTKPPLVGLQYLTPAGHHSGAFEESLQHGFRDGTSEWHTNHATRPLPTWIVHQLMERKSTRFVPSAISNSPLSLDSASLPSSYGPNFKLLTLPLTLYPWFNGVTI